MKITIITQALDEISAEEIADGIEPDLLPEERQEIEVFIDEILPLDPAVDQIRDSVDGEWKIADGFNKMRYELNFEQHDIDPAHSKRCCL